MKLETCSVCWGSGEVNKAHPLASENMSGQVIAERYKSICGQCHGTGIILQEVKSI